MGGSSKSRGPGDSSRGQTRDGPAHQTLEIRDLADGLSEAVLQDTRLRILAVLASSEARRRGGMSLQELGQVLDCSPQNAHHHLRILAGVGAVRVLRTEATQRIPRQFWISDVRSIVLRPDPSTTLEMDLSRGEPLEGRLDGRLSAWAKKNGGPEAERLVIWFGSFLADLDDDATIQCLDLLRDACTSK